VPRVRRGTAARPTPPATPSRGFTGHPVPATCRAADPARLTTAIPPGRDRSPSGSPRVTPGHGRRPSPAATAGPSRPRPPAHPRRDQHHPRRDQHHPASRADQLRGRAGTSRWCDGCAWSRRLHPRRRRFATGWPPVGHRFATSSTPLTPLTPLTTIDRISAAKITYSAMIN